MVMSLGGKHLFGSIDETRVTFVEKKVTKERVEFLKKLLEHTLGVTDMVFNPTIWVYQRKLKTFDGHKVTPDYWEQRSENTPPQYWKTPKDN